jgi:hypothetical protein
MLTLRDSSFNSTLCCLALSIAVVTAPSQSVGNELTQKTITVNQIEGAPVLNIIQRSIVLRAEEGSFDTVRIVSNTKWLVKCKDPWLLTNTNSGENTMRIKISVMENPGVYARTGKVIITVEGLPPGIIEVIQKARHEE